MKTEKNMTIVELKKFIKTFMYVQSMENNDDIHEEFCNDYYYIDFIDEQPYDEDEYQDYDYWLNTNDINLCWIGNDEGGTWTYKTNYYLAVKELNMRIRKEKIKKLLKEGN